jgi:autotransporter-associated beta strand protein
LGVDWALSEADIRNFWFWIEPRSNLMSLRGGVCCIIALLHSRLVFSERRTILKNTTTRSVLKLLRCGSASSRRRSARTWGAAAALASVAMFGAHAVQANTEQDVPNGTTDLTTLGATSTSDVTFTNIVYSPTLFTIGSDVTFGTVNDEDITQALTIQNPNASTTSTLTLAGGANSVASANGGDAADLLYVESGGSLALTGAATGLGTLNLVLSSAGNFDVAGSANIGAAITSSSAITKTGAGTLTLSAANTGLTGGLTIADGTLDAGAPTVAANNNALGANGGAVTLGSGSNNATLGFTSNASGISQNFTVAGTGTDTITSDTGSPTGGNATIFTGGTITLENNLIVSNTLTSAPNGNILGFRQPITQSGGNYGITVAGNNVGTVDFRGANTFGGGVHINAGTVTYNAGSSGPSGAPTSGPLGTGTVTLGSGAADAELASGSFYGLANSLIVAGGGGMRTIAEVSASSTAGVISGPITLDSDLTLAAVASTLSSGVDRLRVGSGGITGSSNIIINNANAQVGAVAGSGAIRLDGGSSPTAWTGNLIVEAGQGSLGSVNAIGANNALAVASGAFFNFSGNGTLSPTVGGLDNATAAGAIGGTTGGVVTQNSSASRTLTLGGSGDYSFAGTVADNTVGNSSTTALSVSLGSGGVQTLSGANTYTGGTTVSSGKLQIANTTGSATGSGTVTVMGDAATTLSGDGISTGPILVDDGSRLAPGINSAGANGNFAGVGTLSVGTNGGLTLGPSAGANLDYDLSTSGLNGDDMIATGGTLSLGTISFTFNELGGSLDTTNPYTLIAGAASTTGFDASDFSTAFLSGIAYTPTYSLNGNNLQVQFAPLAAAPEPSQYVVLGLGLLGLGILTLRARRRAKTTV